MTNVKKSTIIDNYEWFQSLYESWGINGVPQKLLAVIQFMKKNIARCEEESGEYDDEGMELVEILQEWRKAFEEAVNVDSGWGIYLHHKRSKMMINIRPLRKMIVDSNEVHEEVCQNIKNYMGKYLLFPDNIKEYQEMIEIVFLFEMAFMHFNNNKIV
jgi:hypothetical protein